MPGSRLLHVDCVKSENTGHIQTIEARGRTGFGKKNGLTFKTLQHLESIFRIKATAQQPHKLKENRSIRIWDDAFAN